MSNRPYWFRFVVATFVLAFLSATLPALSVDAQDLASPAVPKAELRVGEEGGVKQEIIEEMFPYLSLIHI